MPIALPLSHTVPIANRVRVTMPDAVVALLFALVPVLVFGITAWFGGLDAAIRLGTSLQP